MAKQLIRFKAGQEYYVRHQHDPSYTRKVLILSVADDGFLTDDAKWIEFCFLKDRHNTIHKAQLKTDANQYQYFDIAMWSCTSVWFADPKNIKRGIKKDLYAIARRIEGEKGRDVALVLRMIADAVHNRDIENTGGVELSTIETPQGDMTKISIAFKNQPNKNPRNTHGS